MQISFSQLYTSINTILSKYFAWCAVVVVAVMLLLGWIILLDDRIASIQDAGLVGLQTARSELTKRQQYLAQLQSMSEKYAALDQERLQYLSAILPTQVDEVSLIQTMRVFAEEADMSILSIDVVLAGNAAQIASTQKQASTTVAPLVSHADIYVAHIVMNVQPRTLNYGAFKSFLETLDHFTPVLNLRNLTYTPETTSYALQIETYYTQSSVDTPTQ